MAVFDRHENGSLSPRSLVPTGGAGTGSGLGSQGALSLSDDGEWLLAVNAGSSEITAFAVTPLGLLRTATVPSGGTHPISVTVHDDLVYVLNAGGMGNITGFRLGDRGQLRPLPGSTRPLSSHAAGPAEVAFDARGELLVVTEKTTNMIDTYVVARSGTTTGPMPQPSNGATPFGFAFGKRRTLIVSEAFGGAPDASALSSYHAGEDGTLELISGSVPTHQTAACWVAVTGDGRFAYATNTGSASVSGYAVGDDGSLSLLDPDGRTAQTGPGPADTALSRHSRFLYVRNGGNGSISGFRVRDDGSLEPVGSGQGLPAGAAGLAAR